MNNLYMEEALQMKDQLIVWRRDLHQIPELGLTLPKTIKYVSDVLTELQIPHEVKEDISCVVATLGRGDKCILLRGDMDALPGTERSGETFASTNGCFHGCGHDLHTATMLGAAALLKKHETALPGTVKLLFQSGEEIFKGASAAIAAGVLENPKVDTAFAVHTVAQSALGVVGWSNLLMSSVYGFRITVKGVGGHGSQPERCADPIHAAVQIYQAFQELLARECPPQHAASLTIGHFEAGNAANVIPPEAVLEGTLRTFEPSTRELLIRRINELPPVLASAFRCTASVEELSNVPSVYSDPELTAECLKSIEGITGKHIHMPVMASEDFAFFTELIPSVYISVGSGPADPAERYGQHDPRVRFNEDALPISVAVYLTHAMNWLQNH